MMPSSIRTLRLQGVLAAAWLVGAGCSADQSAATLPDLAQPLPPPPDLSIGGVDAAPDLAVLPAVLARLHICSGTEGDQLRQLAVDASGNLLLGCVFSDTVDFGDGPHTTKGGTDVAIVKLKPTGELVWIRQFGSAMSDVIERLVVDSSGSVIVAGTFQGSLDFGGGPVSSAGGDDYYLAKYDSNGRFLWAKDIGGPNNEYNYHGLAVDPSGNIYYGTNLNAATINLGGGPITTTYMDGILAKFDPSGGHVFSKRIGGRGFDYLMSLALDPNGDILIGGQLSGSVDLGGGVMNPGSEATSWGYVARYDSAGTYRWAQGYYSAGSRFNNLAVDASGSVVAMGMYVGSVQTRTASISEATSALRGFLVQLDRSGKEQWARGIVAGGPSDIPWGVAVGNNQIYAVGEFSDTGNLGLGPRTAKSNDGYLIGYSLTGQPRWLRQYGGSAIDVAFAVAPARDGILVGGAFSGTVDFDGMPLTTLGSTDAYVLKLPLQP